MNRPAALASLALLVLACAAIGLAACGGSGSSPNGVVVERPDLAIPPSVSGRSSVDAVGAPASPLFPPGRSPYRILLTNEEGIEAPGLAAAAQALSGVGTVVVVAPDGPRPGSSQSASWYRGQLRTRQVHLAGAQLAVALRGTPVDAVHLGLQLFGGGETFDLVVAGIGEGATVGEAARFSGAVGAALEAVRLGVPGLAVAQDLLASDPRAAQRALVRVAEKILTEGSPRDVALSLNVPALAGEGDAEVVVTAAGPAYFLSDSYRRLPGEGEVMRWQAAMAPNPELVPGSDTAEYLAGKVTLTPLRFEWRAEEALSHLRGWDLDLSAPTEEEAEAESASAAL